jgi:hypothetical protein
MPAAKGTGDAQMSDQEPSVLTHPKTGVDRAWREKIERAKTAHKEGKELRRGRQVTFTSRRSQALLNPQHQEKGDRHSS